MISTEKMGRCQIVVFFFTLLLALFVSAQLCVCDPQKEAPAASTSFLKGWSEWVQGKMGSYGKKEGETKGASSDTGGWTNWASEKISSFSGRASKATQEGKEKVKAEGEAAASEGQDILKGAKGGVKKGSEIAKDYSGKAKEDIQHQADEATHKLKEDAEL